MDESRRTESLHKLRQAIEEGLASQKAAKGMGSKIQGLYDALTPLALLIKAMQEESGATDATANLALGFSAIIRNADDLAVAGLVMDLLWKVADKEGRDHG